MEKVKEIIHAAAFSKPFGQTAQQVCKEEENKYINQSAESDVGLDATARAASELLGGLCELRESVLCRAGVAQE